MKRIIYSATAFMLSALFTTASAMNFGGTPEYMVSPQGNDAVQQLGASTHTMKAPAKAPATTDEIDVTFAQRVSRALTLNITTGSQVYQAMEFTSDMCAEYAGTKVTTFNLLTGIDNKGQNGVPEVTVFIASGIGKEITYTQTAKLDSKAYTYNKIPLDTTITIEKGKPFVIGYYFTPTSTSGYYVAFDNMPTATKSGGYVGYTKNGVVEWDNIASLYGSLNIGVTLKGGEYKLNSLSITDCELPEYVFPGEAFNLGMTICNSAAGEIKSLEVEYQIADGEISTASADLSGSLLHNQIANIGLSGLVCNTVSSSVPFKIKITKVNGVENVAADNSYSANLICFNREEGFARNFVVEEGTGTWCVYCPAGFVMMEYLKKNFPDNVIRIAVHGSNGAYNKDPMAISSTSVILNYFSGFPQAMIDRSTFFSPTADGILQELSSFFNEEKETPTFCEISKIEVVCGENNSVSISTDATFALDMDNPNNYRLAYYITEDGVGPYDQKNGYAGGKLGEMGGWENENSIVSTYFDEVARYYLGSRQGLTNSLPVQIKKNEPCNYSFEYTIPAVTNQYFYVTAMIISPSGQIINAKQVKASKTNALDRNEIAANDVNVTGATGHIAIAGEYSTAAIYTTAGQIVAHANNNPTINVAPGLYIVTVDGKSFKVIVR